MQLQFISIARLIIDAGGDPWAINDSLQAGRPAQISDLAQAFHDAGQSTTAYNTAFAEARGRFAASWNRENGQHPINDAAEVQRLTKSLDLQAAQLPKIVVDLENIAAALAEAQRESGWYISALEQDLAGIDDEIGEALDDGEEDDANDLYEDAVEETNAVLYQVTQIRDA
jgi:Hydrolase N-terminal helical domain